MTTKPVLPPESPPSPTNSDDDDNSKKRPCPSGCEDETEKLAARREANRVHAFKSRQRSKALLQELQRTVDLLSGEKSELERENAVLRAQVDVLQQQNLALTQSQRMLLIRPGGQGFVPGPAFTGHHPGALGQALGGFGLAAQHALSCVFPAASGAGAPMAAVPQQPPVGSPLPGLFPPPQQQQQQQQQQHVSRESYVFTGQTPAAAQAALAQAAQRFQAAAAAAAQHGQHTAATPVVAVSQPAGAPEQTLTSVLVGQVPSSLPKQQTHQQAQAPPSTAEHGKTAETTPLTSPATVTGSA